MLPELIICSRDKEHWSEIRQPRYLRRTVVADKFFGKFADYWSPIATLTAGLRSGNKNDIVIIEELEVWRESGVFVG